MWLFLKDAWIESTSHRQLQKDPKTTRVVVKTRMPSHAQLTEILGQRSDRSFEVCISDSKHYIVGVLMRETVEDFYKEIDCEIRDIKGCYIVVDVFYYDFCCEHEKFLIYIEKFTYCGGECDTYGDPMDINRSPFLKSLAGSALYASPTLDDLFIHRSTVDSLVYQDHELRALIEQNHSFCSDRCSLCISNNKLDVSDKVVHQATEEVTLEMNEDIVSQECKPRVEKYHPAIGRIRGGRSSLLPQYSVCGVNNSPGIKRVYISEDMYIEKIGSSRNQDLESLVPQKDALAIKSSNEKVGDDGYDLLLNLCSDSEEE